MSESKSSRREFLSSSGSVLGGSWMVLQLPALLATADLACRARETGAAFEVLTPAEGEALAAIASQILPSDETPGAEEAGAVYFMDLALASFYGHLLPVVQQGVKDLNELAHQGFSLGSFTELSLEEQALALQSIESSRFFGVVRMLTLAGVFSHPRHGGNRDQVGWNLIGFDPRGAWQPPFGYYDAQPEDEVANGQ